MPNDYFLKLSEMGSNQVVQNGKQDPTSASEFKLVI